jgi:hypothetical protein
VIRRDRDDGKVEMMKTKVAMLISTAGVLVAGSAAALVNTQVLDGSTPSSALVIDATPASDTVTTVSSVPVVTTPSGGTFTVVTSTVGSATQASFAIGNAGTVVLDTAGDVLTIVGVTPASGWTVTKSEREDSTNVEIKLQSGSAEIEFHANLLFGVVNTSVELHDDSVTSSSTVDTTDTSTSNSLPSTSVDDHGGDGGGDDHSGPGGGDDGNSGPGGGNDDSSGHGGGDDD